MLRILVGKGEKMRVGFIGLGMMGSGICMNIINKSGYSVIAYDINEKALAAFKDRTEIASGIQEVFIKSDVTFLSLPGSIEVEEVTNQFYVYG